MKTFLLIVCFASLAMTSQAETEKTLPAALGIDPASTRGELELAVTEAGAEKEKINLGKNGLYGLGILFQNKDLPQHYRKELKGSDVIQFIFGNVTAGKASQFGALSLLHKGLPAKKLSFAIRLPNPAAPSYNGTGLLLFSSPKNPASQTNEEKLKKTYFCRSGGVSFAAMPGSSPATLTLDGKSLSFQKKTVRLEMNADLASPFNPFPAQIKGWAEVPVLIAQNAQSGSVITRFAVESLEKVMPFHSKPQTTPGAKPKK